MVVKDMDPDEKKRIANEKRLKAVKQWKKNQTVKSVQPRNTHIVFDTDHCIGVDSEKQKPKLFGSEDEDNNFEDAFKTRPQFDGPQGQKLLEMSSQFSGRFKLDERFREDDPEPQESMVQTSEKEKNIKILQSVLGYGISSKSDEKNSPKKRQIRFDPDDENAAKYVKNSEVSETSEPKKKKKKQRKAENDNEPFSVPISTERYIEVSSNLKSILDEAAPFSLSQRFNKFVGYDTFEPKRINAITNVDDYEVKTKHPNELNDTAPKEEGDTRSNLRYISRNQQKYSFFVEKGDSRLKEGVEFFRRPKPMDEIREEWNRRREGILELFRRKKRSGVRSYSSKGQNFRYQNSMRR